MPHLMQVFRAKPDYYNFDGCVSVAPLLAPLPINRGLGTSRACGDHEAPKRRVARFCCCSVAVLVPAQRKELAVRPDEWD